MTRLSDPYTQSDLLAEFDSVNRDVAESFSRIPAAQFFVPSAEGWSPAENLVHLLKSVGPVGKAMKSPEVLAGFGTPTSPSRRYAEIRADYRQRLDEGAQAFGPFLPEVEPAPPDPDQARQALLYKWGEVAQRLVGALQAMSENDLDQYQLPHPLLGNLTIREMLLFTLYHNLLHANEARTFLGDETFAI